MNVIKKILALKYILFLDALLIAACVWMGLQGRAQWMATASAYQVSKIVAPSVAVKQAIAKQKSAEALQKNYMVVASRNIFSPDRNDQVPREDAAKPRPPKPILFGVLNLKEAKLAMMSPPGSHETRSLKIGDKIGDYTLTKILVNKVELKYENETVEATTEEQPKVIPAPAAYAVPGGSTGGGRIVAVDSSGSPGTINPSNVPSAPPVPPPPPQGSCKGHWVKTLFGQTCIEDSK